MHQTVAGANVARVVGVFGLIAVLAGSGVPAGGQDLSLELCTELVARPSLRALYRDGCRPLWVDLAGRTLPAGAEALRLLQSVGVDGLDPDDYAVTRADGPVAFELDLSDAVLRYARDLHVGRVEPRTLHPQFAAAHEGDDVGAWVRTAASSNALPALAVRSRPTDVRYAALAAALAQYRGLAGAEPLGSVTGTTRVRPGDAYAGAGGLWERLRLLGDAPLAGQPPLDGVYAGAVVDAVKAFQERHGLDPDGTLGPRTFEALAVPLSWRIRQIEMAMERLRWQPHAAEDRLLEVNIPLFRLWAWDSLPASGPPAFTSRVIAGRAALTPTPVFTAVLTDILFRPYWNVPRSIVVKEILPVLRTDPRYLQTHEMEVVAGPGDRSPVLGDGPAAIEQLRRGLARLRQRPGPANSLGRLKFSFPNEHDVYMHDTPARALFQRSRRDFSHGCVRVEDAVGLAEWALNDPAWTRERITASMDADVSTRAPVRRAVRVVLSYSTAAVDPVRNTVLFAADIYGHDEALDAALKGRLPAADAAGVHVDEVRGGIVADAAAPD